FARTPKCDEVAIQRLAACKPIALYAQQPLHEDRQQADGHDNGGDFKNLAGHRQEYNASISFKGRGSPMMWCDCLFITKPPDTPGAGSRKATEPPMPECPKASTLGP